MKPAYSKERFKPIWPINQAKETNKRHKPIVFKNGDSPKQLLARSRFILAKREEQWTVNQSNRAIILFRNYPDIESLSLSNSI